MTNKFQRKKFNSKQIFVKLRMMKLNQLAKIKFQLKKQVFEQFIHWFFFFLYIRKN